MLKTDTLENKIDRLLSTFSHKLSVRKQVIVKHYDYDLVVEDQELWTDWKLYICILYHLFYNAIKHGSTG